MLLVSPILLASPSLSSSPSPNSAYSSPLGSPRRQKKEEKVKSEMKNVSRSSTSRQEGVGGLEEGPEEKFFSLQMMMMPTYLPS